MKDLKRALGILVLLACLGMGKTAQAETTASVPTQFDSIFNMVDSLVLGEKVAVQPIKFGGCLPMLNIGFLTVGFKFFQSNTCNISGTITFGLIPMRAEVDLDFFGIPMIQSARFDIIMNLSTQSGVHYTQMDIQNGVLGLRPTPADPLQNWAITGHGLKTKSKGSVQGDFRINLFNEADTSGFALTKTFSQQGKNPRSNLVQVCQLAGADVQNYQAGTMTNCTTLNSK